MSFYVQTNVFYGEYERRMQQERLANEKPSAPLSEEEAAKVKERIGVSVELTEQAKAFLSNAGERKEAAKAQQLAAQSSEVKGNAFQGTGDLKKQHLVISEAFYKMGVYEQMSNDEVRQFEQLLKNITAGMDSINGGNRNLENELSHDAAQVSFASSVAALQELGKKYVSPEHEQSFQALLADYKAHNAANVANHFSIADLAAQNMQRLLGSGYRSNTEEAARALGSVTHSEQQTMALQQQLISLFEQLQQDKPLHAVFEDVEHAIATYASGDKATPSIAKYMQQRDGQQLSGIEAYWHSLTAKIN